MTLQGITSFKIPQDPRDGFGNPNGPATGSYDFYKRVVQAFTWGSASGINLIASSDTSTDAYSVWEFGAADIPFYVMLQNKTGAGPAAFSTTYGHTLWGSNNPAEGGFGVSIAMREDGVNPWSGLATALWNDSNPIFLWPRSNNPGGTHQTNRNNFMPVCTRFDTKWNGSTGHVILDENNFAILSDIGHDRTYDFLYFGKAMVYTGSKVEYPLGNFFYVSLCKFGSSTRNIIDILDFTGDVSIYSPWAYGSLLGNSTLEGGVMLPSASLQGVTSREKSGVRGFNLDLPQRAFWRYGGENLQTVGFPITMFGPPFVYPLFTPSIVVSEYPKGYGLVGYIDWWTVSQGMETHDTMPDFTLAAFGAVTGSNAPIKVVLPWKTIAPTTGADIFGIGI